MKLESYFKYFCFGFSGLLLFIIYSDLIVDKTSFSEYLINIGLFLICIELGVLMTCERLTAKVTFKNFFSKDKSLLVSPVGLLAHILGKIGCILLVVYFAIKFFKE